MGAVHDDVAVHQFGVPLDHTPEVVWERESEIHIQPFWVG